MIWTLKAFEQACRCLTQALGQMADNDDSSLSLGAWALADDQVSQLHNNGRSPVQYLVRRHQVSANVTKGHEAIDLDIDDDDDDCNKIYIDPDVVVHRNTPYPIDDDSNESSSWIWHFSIVYSETWQAPVLFFHVHDLYRGEPCTRTLVVDYLSKLHTQNQVSDSWEFCSQDEHPVTRMPSFFLHPCRTHERLQHLTRVAHPEIDKEENPAVVLLQWMSILLPSVGLAVSSAEFVKVAAILRATKNES